jgi:hypothetical protein
MSLVTREAKRDVTVQSSVALRSRNVRERIRRV